MTDSFLVYILKEKRDKYRERWKICPEEEKPRIEAIGIALSKLIALLDTNKQLSFEDSVEEYFK